MKKAVPDRWKKYTNSGRQISGTRFIPFKTPLRSPVCNSMPPSDSFTTRDLMDNCSSLGLVINLTFKNNPGYYDFQELTYAGIDYSSLPIPGKEIPHRHYVFSFFQIVEKFLKENENNNKLIGVHCTHGINRTGYLICRYMIDRLKVPPDQAIIEFNSARGHEQEHAYYLTDLRSMQLGSEYRAWRKEQAAKNPNKVVSEKGTARSRWQADERATPDDPPQSEFQQMSRKRKSTEMVDAAENSSHKRVKYSSDVTPVAAREDVQRRNSSSPSIGQDYYNQYYRGEVHHQYVMDYYHPRKTETGLSPHAQTSRQQYGNSPSRSASRSDLRPSKVDRSLSLPDTSRGSGKKTVRIVSPNSSVSSLNDVDTSKPKVATPSRTKTKSKKNHEESPKPTSTKSTDVKTKKPSIAQKFINKLKFKKPKRSKGF